MRIAYLVEDSSLSGGLRVVLAQADALTARGHDVAVVAKSAPPDWRSTKARWIRVSHFMEVSGEDYDAVIGTFWTTVPAALEIAGKRAFHLCQGYEGNFTAYRAIRSEIEAVYHLPIAKLVVSPHLVDTLRGFASDVHPVGQIIDEAFFERSSAEAPAERVLLVGAWEIDFKGIDVGYEAVRIARERGVPLKLVRISPWPAAPGEPNDLADEFHVALPTSRMAEVMSSCGLFLGPSRRDEGFGLPAVEAMAMGMPAVLTEIPSFRAFSEEQDFALFAPEDDAAALGEQLVRLSRDAELRRALSLRGRRVARSFDADSVAARIERVISAHRER
jgi:glycosyltransferase involved in cell wall biosynthesis